jgi:hypothetical protein
MFGDLACGAQPYLAVARTSCLSKLLEFFNMPFEGLFCKLSAIVVTEI